LKTAAGIELSGLESRYIRQGRGDHLRKSESVKMEDPFWHKTGVVQVVNGNKLRNFGEKMFFGAG